VSLLPKKSGSSADIIVKMGAMMGSKYQPPWRLRKDVADDQAGVGLTIGFIFGGFSVLR
jgi:hypothetical protein